MKEKKQLSQSQIVSLVKDVKVTSYLDCREILKTVYELLSAEAKKYSYRQFSEDLGFGFTNYLHLILKGERPVSPKAAVRIAQTLGLKGINRQYFVTLAEHAAAKNISQREALFQTLLELKNRELSSDLDRDQLEYFSEWYHPVIREMIGLKLFDATVENVIEKLVPHLTPEQVKRSLELLERIGYIQQNPKSGRLEVTQTHVRTPPEVRGIAVIRYHQQMLELASTSITKVKAARRDISALTLQLSEVSARELKLDIQNFRKMLLQKSEKSQNADQVYQLNIQFFPFTKEPVE